MAKRTKIIILTVVLILLLPIIMFIGLAVLRGEIIPAYASLFYKQGLDKNFASDFSPVNHKLQDFGFGFAKVIQDECWSGDNVMYHDLRETVPCIKQRQSNSVTVTPSFITQWQSESLAFEQYLMSTGWHKVNTNVAQPINGIFNIRGYDGGVEVHYQKDHGKGYCSMDISYGPVQDTSAAKMYVDESCERDVSIFGGYSG